MIEPTRDWSDGRATARAAQRALLDGLDEHVRTHALLNEPFTITSAVYFLSLMPGSVQRLDPQGRMEIGEEILARYGEPAHSGRYVKAHQIAVYEALGSSMATMYRVRRIVEIMDDERLPQTLRDYVRSRLDYVNATGQVSGAHDDVFTALRRHREGLEDIPASSRPVTETGTVHITRNTELAAKRQYDTLVRMISSVAGIAGAGGLFADELLPLEVLLAEGSLDRRQARQMTVQLRDARAALMKLINHLSGKATPAAATTTNTTQSEESTT